MMSVEPPPAVARSFNSVLALADRTLRLALPAVPLLHGLVFLYVTGSRIAYPYELEWMEGGMQEHILRLLHGAPIYIEPSFDFTPFVYPPLYYWLCALAAGVFGPGFVVLRAVSLVASLACAGVMFALARAGGCRRGTAWVAACTFLALFNVSGSWYDLARVDMLAHALMFGAFLACLRARQWKGFLLAVVLAFLAATAKQTALAGGGAVCLILSLRDWRKGLAASALLVLLVLAFCLVMNALTGGWFLYHVFTLPVHKLADARDWRDVLYWEFFISFRVGAFLVVGGIVAAFWNPKDRRTSLGFLVFFLAMTAMSWLARFHPGGFQNSLIPFYMMMGLMMVMAWERAGTGSNPSTAGLLLRLVAHGALLFQFRDLTYSPANRIPTDADREAGDRWVRRIKSAEGEVLLVYSGYLARLAGKTSPSPGLAYHVFIGPPEGRLEYMRSIAEAVRSRRYLLIITADRWLYSENFRGFIVQLYDRLPIPPPGEDAFFPVTGGEVRPEVVYRLKRDLPPYPELPHHPAVVPAPPGL